MGVVSIRDALQKARENEIDLVEISADASPPVCRLMDFGKFKYKQDKLKAAQRKKQKQIQIKEMKFRPGIDDGDYQIKLRKLIEFLNEGNKVKITVRFKGRELLYQELGVDLMQRMEKDLADVAVIELRPKLEGKQLVMVLAPGVKKKIASRTR